ncbi:MAG: hypothetical protein ACJLS3_02725 [Erythrobacter sp.]
MRALMAINMAAAPRAIPADDLRIVTAAFGPPAADRDILANWLMRGGQVAATGEGLSGIYNPLADAWLLLGWDGPPDDPRLVWAALVQGNLLREPGEPDWVDGTGSLASELERAARQSRVAFAALPQSLGRRGLVELVETYRGLEGTLVLERIRQMGGAAARWRKRNPAALGRVRAGLAIGEDPALAALPAPVRGTLVPMAVLTGTGGAVIVLQSARDPARAVLVRATGGRAKPQFSALNLSLAENGSAVP